MEWVREDMQQENMFHQGSPGAGVGAKGRGETMSSERGKIGGRRL